MESKSKGSYKPKVQRQKVDYTHFISIPLNCEEIKTSYLKFKSEMLAKYPDCVCKQLFSSPNTLHLTMLMLPLDTAEKQNLAILAFQSVELQIAKIVSSFSPDGLMIPFEQNMGYFGSPTDTRVLHTRPNNDYPVVEAIKEINGLLIESMVTFGAIREEEFSFIKFNPVAKRFEPDQYHVTIMNSQFAKGELEQKFGSRNFDGSQIIENDLNSLKILPIKALSIDISTRGKYRKDDGYYLPLYSFNL